MRLGQLRGKEIINLHDGTKVGIVTQPDAAIDGVSGHVRLIILPGPFRLFRASPGYFGIPWEAVKKIGHQVIVVDVAPVRENGTLRTV